MDEPVEISTQEDAEALIRRAAARHSKPLTDDEVREGATRLLAILRGEITGLPHSAGTGTMSDTDDGVLPDKDYQPDLPTGTAPDRQRRIAWADDNHDIVDALIAGTLVGAPVEPTEAMAVAGAAFHHDNWRPGHALEDTPMADIYRAMIAEHSKGT